METVGEETEKALEAVVVGGGKYQRSSPLVIVPVPSVLFSRYSISGGGGGGGSGGNMLDIKGSRERRGWMSKSQYRPPYVCRMA